jgi:hypothetical protein
MKPAYNLQPFYASIFLFREGRVLWNSKCFSSLQTTLGVYRELIGLYEPKAKLLISVGKYVRKRRLWKRSVPSILAV